MREARRGKTAALGLAALVMSGFAFGANGTPLGAQAEIVTPRVDFGSVSPYAILGGTAITNTGITPLSGSAGTDVGLWPSSAYTAVPGSFPGVGVVNIANADAV